MSIKPVAAFAFATLAMAPPAGAVVISGTITGGTVATRGGNFIILQNPAGIVVAGNYFDDNNVRAFNEQQNVVLGAPLSLDLGGTIAAGRRVSSQGVEFDPRRNQTATGTITFDRPVLGLIYSRNLLIASDVLGLSSITYLNPLARGLEINPDFVSFFGKTVSYSLSGSNPGDNFRIITGEVPEPASWAMLTIGLGVVGASMRKSRAIVTAA